MVIPETKRLAVASDLLSVGLIERKQGKTGLPLIMEFNIDLEPGPYLVSSSQETLWVFPNVPRIRAAFRPLHLEGFFAEVVEAVAKFGEDRGRCNVRPLSPMGILDAAAYLRSNGFEDREILASPETSWRDEFFFKEVIVDGEVQRSLLGISLEYAGWVPVGTAVVVPQDRNLIGTVHLYEGLGVAVVHNAIRGIAVCRD